MSETRTGLLAGKVALVTGASRGIGRQIVTILISEGCDVAVGYMASEAEARGLVASARERGVRAIAFQADVADETSVALAFEATERALGGLDVVVNAAGVMSLGLLTDFDLHVFDRMVAINVRGTCVVNQQAVRRVRAGGTIVNFSSSVVGRGLPRFAGYAATKAAVEAMTLVLAHELRGRNVTVNAVSPGPTATAMFLTGMSEDTLGRVARAVPLERIGTPADIASVVLFLASPPGHWVNGQTIRVNGGLV